MKKKSKWIVVIVLMLVIAFAPLPVPHFATFNSVRNADGETADVIVKVSFLHFRPLFFHYEEQDEGCFTFGLVSVHSLPSTAQIYALRIDTDSTRIFDEGTYITTLIRNKEDVQDSDGLQDSEIVSAGYGYLVWDESCENIALLTDIPTPLPEDSIRMIDTFTYTAAKKDSVNEFTQLVSVYKDMIF